MAYTVGSASVDIVPDFKNAQLAITKFFQSKPDQYKIPVKLDTTETDTRRVEQQAEKVGTRVGKAISDGASKNDAASVRQAMKTAEAIAAARLKVDRDAEIIRAREEARFRKQEEQFAVRATRAQMDAINKVLANREAARLKIELDERDAIMSGRTYGGLIARSIHTEVRQNAALISAVIAGVLVAGAPVALAAASTLFAGIGAAGAFQSEKLRASWRGLWDEIKSGAVSDAAVLVPAFDRMAGAIGQSFQRMRPQIRDAFEAVSPQIDTFSASVTKAAENALPGLVRAVEAGGPVISGLGDFLEKVGTGVTSFFDRITAHAPAAGATFSALGDSMAVLLPTLGELLGQGAELASIALPALTGALSGLLSVVDSLGGSLPALGAGFLTFRLAQGAGRFVTGWSQSLLKASEAGGMFSGAQAKAGSALSAFGKALPIIGIGVAAYTAAMAQSEQRMQSLTQALFEGGAAAARYREIMGGSDLGREKLAEAEAGARKLLAAMTPLERAQHNLSTATRVLEETMGDEDATAEDLARAKANVAAAAARQAAEEDKLARATQGVTKAMAEQADAARARVDADFGYQKALLDVQDALLKVTDAQTSLDEARADPESGPADIAAAELELKEALLGVNEAYSDQVRLAGEIATSNLPASMDDTQRAILGAKAELDELNRLIAEGVVLPDSLMQYREQLMAITGEADGAMLAQAQLAAALGEIGVAVEAIPGTAAIKIDAPTEEVKQRLLDLGFTVTELPGGEVRVEAKTEEAQAALGTLSADLATLHGTVAAPTATIADGPFKSAFDAIMAGVGVISGQRPTPVADLDDNPFAGVIAKDMASVAILHGQTPTPSASLADGSFMTNYNNAMNRVNTLAGQRPNPTLSANDQASPVINGILSRMGQLADKTVTLTTINKTINQVVNAIPLFGGVGAQGGAIENGRIHHKFDGGGAVIGRGSARDDLVPAIGPDPSARYSIANGEHILDGRDVALMGGQAGVYAFREMLNSGAFRQPRADTGVQQMVAAGAPRLDHAPQQSTRDVRIYTQDNPRAIVRAMQAEKQQAAALAPAWP